MRHCHPNSSRHKYNSDNAVDVVVALRGNLISRLSAEEEEGGREGAAAEAEDAAAKHLEAGGKRGTGSGPGRRG